MGRALEGEAMAKSQTSKAGEACYPLTQLATRINEEHRAVIAAMNRGIEHAIVAGELLRQAKGPVGHGKWTPWLRKHCPTIKGRTARLYMQIARGKAQVRAKMATVADLTLQQAAVVASGCERRGPNADDEWYTPPEIIELVRRVLGEIDLDPAPLLRRSRPFKRSVSTRSVTTG
jgi:hypothetical protein